MLVLAVMLVLVSREGLGLVGGEDDLYFAAADESV